VGENNTSFLTPYLPGVVFWGSHSLSVCVIASIEYYWNTICKPFRAGPHGMLTWLTRADLDTEILPKHG
jgi:hypothetical protein